MNQKYLVASLALLGIAGPAQAESKCEVGQLAQLPVTMVGFRPEVHAKINGKDAVFVADSGAWYSLISPGSAAEYGLRLSDLPPGYFNTGIGGTFVPKLTTVQSFTIAGVAVPRVQFLVGGSEVGSVGLLGQNVLAIFDTEFDLANGMIKLMRSHNCGKADLAYWAPASAAYSMLQTEPMPSERPHIVASVYINGIKLRAVFDTGAERSFVSLRAAAKVGLKPDGPGVVPAGESGGLGRHFVRTWIGPVASIKIGDEEIRNTRLRFGDDDMTEFDMLLGADFFLSHHIYWSNASNRLFFTFNGGNVFDLRHLRERGGPVQAEAKPDDTPAGDAAAAPADAAASQTVPTDAEGFSRRGAARAVRNDIPGAFADFAEAIKRAPDNVEYLRQRARLYAQTRQPILAVNDIDQLLKLKPDDVDALIMRASMRLRLDRHSDVRSDLDAAAAAAAPSSDRRLALAGFYETMEDYPKAIAQYDLWIAAHPDDNRRPVALNGRCWARALANIEIDRALKDCNAALSAMPHTAGFLDSRGLVRLRMGAYAQAVTDYDEAIKTMPKSAWSHYGRGIAELRLGRKADGDADIAKAKEIDADMPDEAKKRGVVP